MVKTVKDKNNKENFVEVIEQNNERAVIAFAYTDYVEFDPYHQSLSIEKYKKSEEGMFVYYDEIYQNNPFTSYLVDTFVQNVFSVGFHFEGEQKEEAELFFNKDETKKKLISMVRDGGIFGNGYIGFDFKGKKIKSTYFVDGKDVGISANTDKKTIEYTLANILDKNRQTYDLSKGKFAHFTIKKLPSSLYGISPLRGIFFILKNLNIIADDIPAAMKRIAYAPIIVELDLTDFVTPEDKQAEIDAYSLKLQSYKSATGNMVYDGKHKISVLGQGGNGARMLPVRDLTEMLVGIAFLTFGVPLGLYLQGDANKALIEEERKASRIFYNYLRGEIADIVNNDILPKAIGDNVKCVWNKDPEVVVETMPIFINAVKEGLVSREEFRDYFDLQFEGVEKATQPEKEGVDENE